MTNDSGLFSKLLTISVYAFSAGIWSMSPMPYATPVAVLCGLVVIVFGAWTVIDVEARVPRD